MVGDIITSDKKPYFYKVVKESKTVGYMKPLKFAEIPNGDGRTKYVPYNDDFVSDELIRFRFNKWCQATMNKEVLYPWAGDVIE